MLLETFTSTLPTTRIGFLKWIARITIVDYYEEYNAQTGNAEMSVEDEVEALASYTELWLTNDKPDATEQEVWEFMFDNRRI